MKQDQKIQEQNPDLVNALHLIKSELYKKRANTQDKRLFILISERLKHAEEVISHNTLVIENLKKILVAEDEKQPVGNHNSFVKEQIISADNTLNYWVLCRDIYKGFFSGC